jgi:uncharacterized protein (TIGR02147 family)
MPNIYEYTEYRSYLKAFIAEAKARTPVFSHRYLAQKLGLSTPNLILLIIQGKRNLTPTICFKLSEFMKHTCKEARYFEHMVSFDQAKTHEERNAHYASMLDLKRTVQAAPIERQHYEYYSNWYNPVIRELVVAPDFSGDFKALAKSVSPAITPDQARRSVELLKELGLIRENAGRYEQADPLVSTGPNADSIAVANFHRKTAYLAAESFDRHARQERAITSCTVTLSDEHMKQLKLEIADLRKRALELAEEPRAGNKVFQLNIQMFPVSKAIKKADDHEK